MPGLTAAQINTRAKGYVRPVPEPPEPFTLPVVLCPACSHGINPHTGWGEPCGVGDEQADPCACMWTPNDIAAWHMANTADQATP